MNAGNRGAPLPRPAVARHYRQPMERFESLVPLPNVPPVVWTAAGVAVSFLVWAPFAAAVLTRGILVAAALLADWLDGATARRFGPRPHGQLLDVAADRISELAIFASDPSALGRVMLALTVANVLLVILGRARGRHWALPLRFAYLVLLPVS